MMTWNNRLLCSLLLMSLAACASPQGRIRAGLQSLGVPREPARCMAAEMDRRLDGRQIDAVADLLDGVRSRRPVRTDREGVRQGLDVLVRAADPGIADTAARAGVACLLMG